MLLCGEASDVRAAWTESELGKCKREGVQQLLQRFHDARIIQFGVKPGAHGSL